jgi:hypothetical protein
MSLYIAAIRGDRATTVTFPRDEVPLRPIRPGAFAAWLARMEAREAAPTSVPTPAKAPLLRQPKRL